MRIQVLRAWNRRSKKPSQVTKQMACALLRTWPPFGWLSIGLIPLLRGLKAEVYRTGFSELVLFLTV
jgi:hypothetical protein